MEQVQKTSRAPGILLAILAVPVGIIIWVIIWRLGYLAAIASFVMALMAVWLYEKGTKQKPDLIGAIWLTVIVIVGSILAFIGGMISDGIAGIMNASGMSMTESMSYTVNLLFSSEGAALWAGYAQDAWMAALFTVLGAGWVLYNAFRSTAAEEDQKANSDSSESAKS